MKKILISLFLFLQITILFSQSLPPTARGEVIEHTYYTLSYIEQHEQPEWVYYVLTGDMISGAAKRGNDFRSDPKVPTESAQLNDYKGSGYDRGHLAPAASMSINSTAMSESFYMSNMSPQEPGFNRGIWKNLEKTVRGFVSSEGGSQKEATSSVQCKGIASSTGQRCKNKATNPNGYCRYHQPKP